MEASVASEAEVSELQTDTDTAGAGICVEGDIVEDDEEEEEEEEDDDEEEEPKLKFARVANDLRNILTKDAASCIAVHPKFVCIGSLWGVIHMLDHQGNSIRSKELHAHSVAVNQISIDQSGDFIASCSDDGKVFVCGLYSTEESQSVVIGRLVKSVAIDPAYSKPGSGRRFITGDERLVLHERTFLSRLKSTVLYEAEGSVQNIRWHGQFVAWASDIGVRVYDVSARHSLGLIKWNRNPGALPEDYRCNLCWKSGSVLLVAWVDTVRICKVRKRSTLEMTGRDDPEYVVQQISMFTTDFYLCGIGPLDSQAVLLGFPKEPDAEGKAQRPQLYVVEPRDMDSVEVSMVSLTLRGYQDYKCNDYHLECLVEENRFFIVSPKDVVEASPYDADDRVQWLLDHGKYEAAMEAVTQLEGRDLKRFTVLEVGRIYLDHLLAAGRYDEAGKLALKLFGKDKKRWEEEVFKFARVKQLRAVSKYLPRGDHALDPHVYEMVLYEYLKMEPQGFLQVVKEWSPTLYNVPAVVNAVLEHLLVSERERAVLLEALAILYTHERKYDKALAMYLKLKHAGVFQLIRKHNLFGAIHDTIEELMDLDVDRAIATLLEKEAVPADVVVARLQRNPRYLYLYLDALDKRDAKEVARKYHGLMVRLYADFARDKLLPFLRRSDRYPIQEALDACRQRGFHPEMIYLLGRMGNTQEALTLIIRELQDVEQAIEFCKEHDDPELWGDLVECSLDRPEFISFLLSRIGTYVDPRMLVRRIRPGLAVPRLRASLVKMMHDYKLQVSVQEGCRKILAADYFELHRRLVALQQRAVAVDDDQVCRACHRPIILRDLSGADNVVVFHCKHCFHEGCVPGAQTRGLCAICHSATAVLPDK
ncbi:vacuolar protein sorting-associated protein 41 homolog isoform X2 [Bacillus rossius redtenbacheri]